MDQGVEKMKRYLGFALICFFGGLWSSVFISAALAKEACVSPLWVNKAPNLEGYYWGVGEARLNRNRDQAMIHAYEIAVSNLALMAGQTIVASFEAYQEESTVGSKAIQQNKIHHKIKTISEHNLRGIRIKDFWTDSCHKIYYVWVVIGRQEANEQIRKNARDLKDRQLKDVISKGISRLEGEIDQLSNKVDSLAAKSDQLESKYGTFLGRLAVLEEAGKKQRLLDRTSSQAIADLTEQVERIKADIAGGVSLEKIEARITAAEWFRKAFDLQATLRARDDKQAGAYVEVIRLYTKAIELNPEFVAAYNNRGAAYGDKGEYFQAKENFAIAIKLDSWYAPAYYNRGYIQYGRGEHKQAVKDFTMAIELNPNYIEAYNNRGAAYSHQGKYDQAIQDYSQTIALAPGYGDAYFNRGCAYAKKGRYEEAIADFTMTIELDPTDGSAYHNRGEARQKRGEIRGSAKDFQKACNLNYSAACRRK